MKPTPTSHRKYAIYAFGHLVGVYTNKSRMYLDAYISVFTSHRSDTDKLTEIHLIQSAIKSITEMDEYTRLLLKEERQVERMWANLKVTDAGEVVNSRKAYADWTYKKQWLLNKKAKEETSKSLQV